MTDLKIPAGVQLAPVDKYPPVAPDGDLRSSVDTVLAENRLGAVDQIPDYHDVNPPTKTTGPAFDPEVAHALALDAVKGPTKADVKAAAAEIDVALPPAGSV